MIIDLSHYYLCEADKSWCKCKAKIFFLFPREGHEEKPMFMMCPTCGRILQCGVAEEIGSEITR